MKADSNKLSSKIENVCFDCGKKALKRPENKGKKQKDVSTVHSDYCDICGEKKPCTEPRDFGYPVFEIEEYWIYHKLGL